MGWSGIANFGLGYRGATDVLNASSDRDYLERQRKRTEEVNNMALEEARRQDELGKTVRGIARKYGLGGEGQLPAIPGTSAEVAPTIAVDDEGNPMPTVTKTTPAVPAQANSQGMREAMAQAYEGQGKLTEADAIRKAMKAVETEGYSEILRGVAAGDDPNAIAQRFNRKGNRRIVNGEKQGDAYVFTYEDGKTQQMDKAGATDLGTKLGLFKRDMTILPQGSTAIDASGAVVARGQPKAETRHNIDPLSPEGIKAAEEKARALQRVKNQLGGGAKATAMIQNVQWLSDNMGLSVEEAYNLSREGMHKPEVELVLDTAVKLKQGEMSGKYEKNPEAVFEDARKMVAEARKSVDKPRGKKNEPELLNSVPPDEKGVPKTLLSPEGKPATFTGRYTRAGKPIYTDGQQQFVGE